MDKINRGRWSEGEQTKFNYAVRLNLSWKEVAEYIGTRTADQCRSHNQKMKLLLYNKKSYVATMYYLVRVNKETQYESQIQDYSIQAVILKTKSESPAYSQETEETLEFDFISEYFSEY